MLCYSKPVPHDQVRTMKNDLTPGPYDHNPPPYDHDPYNTHPYDVSISRQSSWTGQKQK